MLIYDDATPRPQTFGTGSNQPFAYRPAHLEWGADATMLYACASSINYDGAPMLELAVDGMGLTLTSEPLMTAGTPMHFLNGLVYEDYGVIFDPVIHALTAQMIGTVEENRAMSLDAVNNKVFMATAVPETDDSNGVAIKSYDLTTFAPIASVEMPGLHPSIQKVERWGTNGIAVLDGGREHIVVISGNFVKP